MSLLIFFRPVFEARTNPKLLTLNPTVSLLAVSPPRVASVLTIGTPKPSTISDFLNSAIPAGLTVATDMSAPKGLILPPAPNDRAEFC